jgi:hypothetical protein
MASYTDNIPTFNPYVQTLPVDEMVKVGIYKQQKYDEGIQKIQTNIDNIAGLDVVRDVDKAYLQSKLNQLSNNLTTVAAGDFSNFQLVNSVNGMTNQIARDPNVLNAISSAKTYRKGLEDMDAANKAGKGAASHDWEFKTQANNWLSSQDINKTFSGGYKQYSPYQKNAQEVIKGLIKNETGRDVAFEYDANGNIAKDKNGQMIILDAMTRTKISGITPERIQSALMVGLSPNDWQSMQIDGRYNYANVTPEQFTADLNKSYKSDYDKLKQLRQMTANAMDSTNSSVEKSKLQQQVDSLDKSLKSVQDEYSSVSKTFAQGDVESAKARYYTTKWVNNFSQTFASKDAIQSYESSPFQQVKQFKETKEIEYKKWLNTFNQNERFHRDSEYWKSREDRRAENQDKREQKKADDEGWDWGGLGFSVPQDELPEVTVSRVKNQIAADQKLVSDSDAAIMKQFNKAGDTQWLNQQQAAWQKNPGSVDPLLAAHFHDTETTRREVAANTSMVAGIASQMDKKYGQIEDYIPEGSTGVAVKFSPSNTVTYNPKDFVNFNSKLSRYVTMTNDNFDSGGGTASMIYDDKKAKAELTSKEYYLYEAYKASRSSRNSAQQMLADNIQKYRLQVNQPFQRVIAQRTEEENKLITERTVAMQGKRYGIPLNNEAQKTSFGNVLQEFADLADSQNGALALSPDVTASELRDIAADVQNANIETVEATKFAPARYRITAANKKGDTVTFNMTPEQYASVTKGKFDADQNILAIRDLEAQQIRAGGGTTALDGEKTNVGNAFMGNALNFINVRHYSVSGNLVTNQNGLSSIRLNVSDPRTGEVIVEDLGYPRGGLIDKNKVLPAMQGLTDQVIFEMLYNRKPTAAELKQLQQ